MIAPCSTSRPAVNQPTDLFLADSEGGNEQQLTTLNDDFLAGIAPARVEHMLFPGIDGVGVEGWTIMPAEGDGPFPAVLYIHGGPAQRLRACLPF